ncbi:MAG: hypothetical protein MJ230_07445 [bacterium]|nr:hypothetical protein [bacterium]
MNSVPSVISLKSANLEQLKQNQNQNVYANQTPMSMMQYDTFSPSFKAKGNISNFKKAMLPKIVGLEMFFGNVMQGAKNVVSPEIAPVMLGGLAVLAPATMTSCKKSLIEPESPTVIVNEGGVTVNVNTEVNLYLNQNITITYDQSDIASLLLAIQQQNIEMWNEVISHLVEINGNLQVLPQIIALLVQQGAQLNDIITIMDEGFQQIAGDNEELKAILYAIQEAVTNGNNLSAQGNQMLASLIMIVSQLAHDQNIANNTIIQQLGGLDAVIALLQQAVQGINSMNENQQEAFTAFFATLQSILNKLDQMDENQQQAASALLNMGQAILDKLGQMDETQQQAFNVFISLWQDILDKLDNMDASQQQYFTEMLNKVSQMDINCQEAFIQIINGIGQSSSDVLAAFATLFNKLDTIIANQNDQNVQLDEVIQNQQTQIQELFAIYNKIEEGNVTMQEIKTVLENMSTGQYPQVDLALIESLLQQILAKQDAILNNNNENATLIASLLQVLNAKADAIQNSVNALSVQEHQDLMAILDAIQNINIPECGCDCGRIIELIVVIIQQLEEGGFNHEGIEDDFGDILG